MSNVATYPFVPASKLYYLDELFVEDFTGPSPIQRWEMNGLQLTITHHIDEQPMGEISGSGVMIASASCGGKYKVEAIVGDVPISGGDSVGLIVLQSDSDSFYSFKYEVSKSEGCWSINKIRKTCLHTLNSKSSFAVLGEHLLAVTVSENQFGQTIIKGYCDGALMCQAADIGPKRGKAGIFLSSNKSLLVKNFKVTCPPAAGDNFEDFTKSGWTDNGKFSETNGAYQINLFSSDNVPYYAIMNIGPETDDTLADFAVQADLKFNLLKSTDQRLGLVINSGGMKTAPYYFFGYYRNGTDFGWKFISVDTQGKETILSSVTEGLEDGGKYQLRLELRQYQLSNPHPNPATQEPGSKKAVQVIGYVNGIIKFQTNWIEGENPDLTNFVLSQTGIMVKNIRVEMDNFRVYSLSVKGWYRGDHHCHAKKQVSYESVFGGDDGDLQPGAIVDGCRMDDSLDYLILTPHNQINHTHKESDIGQNKKFEMACKNDFVSMSEGCEETTATTLLYGIQPDDTHGHMCVYFSKFKREKYRVDDVSEYTWNERPDNLENNLRYGKAIDDVDHYGGFVYINHPVTNEDSVTGLANDSMNWQEWTLERRWGTSVKGLEAWRGGSSASWSPYLRESFWNNTAFEKWDELNCEGKKLWSLTNTDAHSRDKFGAIWTVGYLKEFTKQGIRDNIRKIGNMYGSNGPLLYFRAESNGRLYEMGSAISGIPSSGGIILIRYGATGHYRENRALNEITIYKNGIPLQEFEKEGFPYNPDTSTPDGFVPNLIANNHFDLAKNKICSFENTVSVKVEPGDFLRMVVKAYDSDGKVTGFAYSNPVFIETISGKIILMESFSDKARYKTDDGDWGRTDDSFGNYLLEPDRNVGKAAEHANDITGFGIHLLEPGRNVGKATEHANDITRAVYLGIDSKCHGSTYYKGWKETGSGLFHYFVEANFRRRNPRSGEGFFGVMARYTSMDNYIAFVCFYGKNGLSWKLVYRVNKTDTNIPITQTVPIVSQVSNLRLEVKDVQNETRICGYVNGVLYGDATLNAQNALKGSGGMIGLVAKDVSIWVDDIKAMKLD
jgi:hypothetical protein